MRNRPRPGAAGLVVVPALLGALALAGCLGAPEDLSRLPGAVRDLAPRAVLAADKLEAAPGERIRFDATRSLDPDGRIVSFRWLFGDGEDAAGPDKARISHAFREPGAYQVVLTVQDEEGLAATASLRVGVRLVLDAQSAVAAATPEGGTASTWSQLFAVKPGAEALEVNLTALPRGAGPAALAVRLVDGEGRTAWQRTLDLPPEGAVLNESLGGGALAAAGLWRVEASAPYGAAAFDGQLRVRYVLPPALPAPR